MKVLILNYEYPPLGGGTGVVSRYHAEMFAEKGIDVTVITTWFKGEKEIEIKNNLKIIRLKSKRRYNYKSTPDEWISWIRKSKKFLSEYLKNNQFEFCFAHFALPGGEVAKYIFNNFKIPYAIVSHGQDIPWFFPKQMFKYHILTYFYIKNICKKSEKLILLTNKMKENADRFMGKYKYKNTVIPNGCRTDIFKPDYSIRKNKFTILFVGRLVHQKDPFTFLKAVKILYEKKNIDFEIKILGDGPLLRKMKEYVKKSKLEEIVNFKGWVSKEELLKEYQSASLQVISSKAEAMSIAALESLSSGLYIISTPVSGNTDIIEEKINGEFFKFNNANILADKISDFYYTKYLKNYKVNQDFLSDFRKKYDWDSIIGEYLNLLKSIKINA